MAAIILAFAALAAAGPAARPVEESPAAASPVAAASLAPVLAYIPEEADLVVHVRAAALTRTHLWKMLADPAVGLRRRLMANLPPQVNLEADVVAAALVSSPQDLLDEGNFGLVLALNRDVLAGDLLEDPQPVVPVPGIPTPVYRFGEAGWLAVPAPRVAVIASNRDYLTRMLTAPRRPTTGPAPKPAAPPSGEVAFVARMPASLKDAILEEYRRFQQKTLRPNMDTDALMAFALHYNLVRIALQAETVTGSLALSRASDAFRADVRFASPQMAPFMADVLQALADPLQMALPALLGGHPRLEPPAEPLYRAAADQGMVRLVMSRAAVYRFVNNLADTVKRVTSDDVARKASARNLLILGEAVHVYHAMKATWPKTWSDLTRENLVRDPEVFSNPARKTHRAAGDYELVPLTKRVTERAYLPAVLAYEVYPVGREPPRLNVLFADGHVEWIDLATFRRLYRQTLETFGRENGLNGPSQGETDATNVRQPVDDSRHHR